MKNEIGRKLTSLTLMTIMVAGGLTFAIPGAMPQAYAGAVQSNPHLYVSAEGQNSLNEVSPVNIIEIAVIDPLISDTDEGKGEPNVQVNGAEVRMAQATDGAWYAYIADTDGARHLDAAATGADKGNSTDVGAFCSADSGALERTPPFFSESRGVAFARQHDGAILGVNGTATDTQTLPVCDGPSDPTGPLLNNVVREAEELNCNVGITNCGQIGINQSAVNLWPFVQLYDFAEDGDIDIVYNRPGGEESVSLLIDDPEENIAFDRNEMPQGAAIFFTVNDLTLNIDPTDEDHWVAQTAEVTGNFTLYYQLFDENGDTSGDGTGAEGINLYDVAVPGFDDAFDEVLKLNRNAQGGDPQIDCQPNDDFDGSTTTVTATPTGECMTSGGVPSTDFPVSMVEDESNSSDFINWDENNVPNLVVRDEALRGISFEAEYEEPGFTSVVVRHFFGDINIDTPEGDWSSGERIGFEVADQDQNKNSLVSEDFDLFDPTKELIPTLRIGDPLTLGEESILDGDAFPTFTFFNNTFDFGTSPDLTTTGTLLVNSTNGTVANDVVKGEDRDEDDVPDAPQSFSDRAIIDPVVDDFSIIQSPTAFTAGGLLIDLDADMADLYDSIFEPERDDPADFGCQLCDPPTGFDEGFEGRNSFNLDIRSLDNAGLTPDDVFLISHPFDADFINVNNTALQLLDGVGPQGLTDLVAVDKDDLFGFPPGDSMGLIITFVNDTALDSAATDFDEYPLVADFFSQGITGDRGLNAQDRINNGIYRVEAEETGDNTGVFAGSLEFIMLNQLNIFDDDIYDRLRTIDDEILFIVQDDLTDEDAPRVNYFDRGEDGVDTQIGVQEDAPTHSGIVSFDLDTYKIADTVLVTAEDRDLNTDNDTIDIFTIVEPAVGPSDAAAETVGEPGLDTYADETAFGRLLDITFDDELWAASGMDIDGDDCLADPVGAGIDDGFFSTGATLRETEPDSGQFLLDFQIPAEYCSRANDGARSTTGVDLEVNLLDFRDGSGEVIEVGDAAGIRANTGSVSLDRTVFPVPFGNLDDITGGSTGDTGPEGYSVFPIHATGVQGDVDGAKDPGPGSLVEVLPNGDLIFHVRINDPDFDVSASGEDKIAETAATPKANGGGPILLTIERGADTVILGTAGAPSAIPGVITLGDDIMGDTREFGPITEIAPDAGVFELDVPVRWTDGPPDSQCPFVPDGAGSTLVKSLTGGPTFNDDESFRFGFAAADDPETTGDGFCILQGDILNVEYEDPTDASGEPNTVTDSATFDLRNGVLQSDKSVYIIGSDAILTLIEPDLDLDNDAAETWDLDLLEWDSDAATITMGNAGGEQAAFDPEPSDFRETGDSTGIFQIVTEIPEVLDGDRLERGEEAILEYTDWGPSGSDFVGDEDEDVNLTLFTSNFGATIELDQKVYSWTDKAFVTIVAPDHNFDSNLVDEIGDTDLDPIKVSTRGHDIDNYKMVETGTDTGIFTAEVILTGFCHDADGDVDTGAGAGAACPAGSDTKPRTSADGSGPTNGFIEADDDDGLTISFEFSEDETVVGSALVRWNIGEVQWLEASYPASGTGVVRVVDPDMNLDPESVDNFDVDSWSDSDSGGIDLTVTETNEATGIFEGTVFFTTTDESSGHRLRVSEGDTVTAEYEDNTLPDPYTTADELDILGTAIIGTVVPPLERAPAANPRAVDAFGNALDSICVDQQVQITADLANGQDREQQFAYIVQIQDGNGVTVGLAWITGTLAPGQSFSPALSWIPTAPGTYTASVFVWESIDNPTALSPPVQQTIIVNNC